LPSGGLVVAQRKELYAESYRRMDEWLVDRMDVDLGAYHRFGSTAAGLRDKKAGVQEIDTNHENNN